MIILMAFALFHETSRAEKPRCERTYITQCKAAVHDVKMHQTSAAGEEAHAQCTELLDACQTKCLARVHKCQAGMSAPMHLAAVTARGAREPSSETRLRPEDHRFMTPSPAEILDVEF